MSIIFRIVSELLWSSVNLRMTQYIYTTYIYLLIFWVTITNWSISFIHVYLCPLFPGLCLNCYECQSKDDTVCLDPFTDERKDIVGDAECDPKATHCVKYKTVMHLLDSGFITGRARGKGSSFPIVVWSDFKSYNHLWYKLNSFNSCINLCMYLIYKNYLFLHVCKIGRDTLKKLYIEN